MRMTRFRTGLKIVEIILTGVLVLLLGLAFWQVAGSAELPTTFLSEQTGTTRQYALIMDIEMTAASRGVLEGLKASAKDSKSVITLYTIQDDAALSDAFTLAELTNCEGIFVKLRKNKGASQFIQKAVQSGKRVVVIDHDAPDSLRDAYVGANPLLVGKKAAEMAKEHMPDALGQEILILLGASHQDASGIASSAYLNGFRQTLEKSEVSPGFKVAYTSENAPEVIVEKALKEGLAKVFVCTEPEDTIKVMNVLIDYNRIKDVALIGSGNTPAVIEGVDKGLIEASIHVDFYAMGREAMALMTKLVNEDAPTAYQLMPIDVIEGP